MPPNKVKVNCPLAFVNTLLPELSTFIETFDKLIKESFVFTVVSN